MRPTIGGVPRFRCAECLRRARTDRLSRTSYPAPFIALTISSAARAGRCGGKRPQADRLRRNGPRQGGGRGFPKRLRAPQHHLRLDGVAGIEGLGTLSSAAAGMKSRRPSFSVRSAGPACRSLQIVERCAEQQFDRVVCSLGAVDHNLRRNDCILSVKQKRLLGERCQSSPKRSSQ